MSVGLNAPQGIASFPGINTIISASYNRVHGISPGLCSIEIVPQADFVASDGTLVFSFGDVSLVFPDCRVDYATLDLQPNGYVWRLQIMDRRWKWRAFSGGGGISGSYNVWRDNFTLEDGKVDSNNAEASLLVIDTEKTPAELAKLCLEAMGEEGYDTSALPEDPRPSVHWNYTNPADALAELCDEMGCRIVLALDNTVKIVTVGEGADLPQDGILHPSYTLNPPDMPDKIAIVCGLTRYQLDFQIEMVGRDNPINGDPADSTLVGIPGDSASVTGALIRPLNKLSYAKDSNDSRGLGGFRLGEINSGFLSLAGTHTDAEGHETTGLRQLAQSSVARFGRVKLPVRCPGSDTVGDRQISILQQVLPLGQDQVNAWRINYEQENIPATVFGLFWPALADFLNSQPTLSPAPALTPGHLPTNTRTIFYRKPFTIDSAHGLVIFQDPVYMNTDGVATDPARVAAGEKPAAMTEGAAQLVLRCAVNVLDEDTSAPDRYVRTRDTGANNGTGTRYIHHDEIVLSIIPQYDSSSYAQIYDAGADEDPRTITSVVSNLQKVNDECDFYLDAAMKEYQSTEALQLSYVGLRGDIDLDGSIQHVVYLVGSSGCTTSASQNSEMLNKVVSYRERRRRDRTAAFIASAAAFAANAAPLSPNRPGAGF